MFFEEIEEFRTLSKSAKIAETNAQIMDMALTILHDSSAFTQSLTERKQKQEIKNLGDPNNLIDDAHRTLRVPISQSQF